MSRPHVAIDEVPIVGTPIVGPRPHLPLRPLCALCRAPADRALVVRIPGTDHFRAHVHCHGASEVLELPDNATERDVETAIAFKKGT